MAESGPTYCCKMREKFVVGIIGVNADVPEPVDLIDFLDFDVKTPGGRPILHIRFCPFCGKSVPREATKRVVEPPWKKGEGPGDERPEGSFDPPEEYRPDDPGDEDAE
jgi:hypothetical protein